MPLKSDAQEVKAIDARPYRWSIVCTIGDDPKPVAIPIVRRNWSEDGTKIFLMLDTHNCVIAEPDEMLTLEPEDASRLLPELLAKIDAEDAKRMAARPLAPACEEDRCAAALEWVADELDAAEQRHSYTKATLIENLRDRVNAALRRGVYG